MNTTRTILLTLSVLLVMAGCKSQSSAADDAALSAKVQSSILADPNLAGQTIAASASNGTVTLNGAVTSDAARTTAHQDASQIAGVGKIVDNLVVQAQSASATAVAAAPAAVAPVDTPAPAANIGKPSAVRRSTPAPPAPIVRSNPVAAPAPQRPSQAAVAEVQPPPPPAPTEHNITLAAGTDIPVRITQTLDSATTQTGDRFTGVVASDIIVHNLVVLPQGTPVTGHVDDARDAAHFKGSSLLTISLSAINRKGEHIEVATDPYSREGEGRGKNTAEKVGGGAAVGAILGGIFGGGKGAAIGSVAGGGLGAGAQGVTRGQQVQIPSETVVRFRLSNPIIVRVTTGPGAAGGSALERRNDR